MVTDQQVRRLRRLDLCGLSKERVADKAGMDAKTARKYRRLGKTRPHPAVDAGLIESDGAGVWRLNLKKATKKP